MNPKLTQDERRILELEAALRMLVAVAPTTIPPLEDGDCIWCHYGMVNVGTAIDPEPGPCPRCRCELHRESHEDCFDNARRVLGMEAEG